MTEPQDINKREEVIKWAESRQVSDLKRIRDLKASYRVRPRQYTGMSFTAWVQAHSK